MAKSKEKKGQIVPRVSRDLTPFDEMERFFNRFWGGGLMHPFGSHWPRWADFSAFEERIPKIDIIERENEVFVRAELPGVSKDNLDVSLTEEFLTIKAETREEKKEEGEYYRSEIRRGSFSRTVHLPAPVDGEQAEASFKNGVLEVTIPKLEQKERRSIPIQ